MTELIEIAKMILIGGGVVIGGILLVIGIGHRS